MTPDTFRRLALSLPEASEGRHGGHADFRVGGKKVFASLDAQETHGNLRVEPGRLAALSARWPSVFAAHNGAWGAQGWTRIALAALDDAGAAPERAETIEALWVSWRIAAPPALAHLHAAGGPRLRRAWPEEIDLILALDDDACAVYGERGLDVALSHDHPFVQAERARWLAGAAEGRVRFCELDGAGGAPPVGFVACDTVDGLPYLDQLSVRRAHMQRGLGAYMLHAAQAWAAPAGELWLTTYAHLPWNAPFYARHGFAIVPEAACGPEVRAILAGQRACLPDPAERVAMRSLSTRSRSRR